MRIEYDRQGPEKIQGLMYVGDDGLPPDLAGRNALILAGAALAAYLLLVRPSSRRRR